MGFSETKITGVFLFTPELFTDSRGEFYESFRRDKTLEQTGFDFEVQQLNTSVSQKGVIRGIHFKRYPPGQAKFVSVSQGAILDVAIDLRKSSATFGHFQAFELTASNRNSLLLGYGIGHAFLCVEDNTKVSYLCDSVFQPELEFGINPFDSGINWESLAKPFGISEFELSDKDTGSGAFADAAELLFD